MSTIGELLSNRKLLEEVLIDNLGEMDTELDRLWEDNTRALQEKVDNYGLVIKHLESVKALAKENKKERDTRYKALDERIENEIAKIKKRLNHYAEGNPLRGHEFSFHPFITDQKKIKEGVEIEPEYYSYTIKLNYEQMCYLRRSFEPLSYPIEKKELFGSILCCFDNAKKEVKVSDLPEGHPAIEKIQEPSVRVR